MTTKRGEAPCTTKLFDSLDALADYAAGGTFRNSGGDAWAGATLNEALRFTRDGDPRLVAQSDGLLRKFESLTFPTNRRQWLAAEAGHVPNVPAFIAGHPPSMRRRAKREHDAAPVPVYVDLFLSAAFNADAAMARGAAVLALVRVLAAHRAVTLYVGYGTTTYGGHTLCPMVRLNT